MRFGSSGIRGLGNVEVTPELALRVGSVIGELYGDSVIGRDPRTTGPMLVQAFAAGVLSTGSAAVDAGLVSTPTLARGARDFACGAMITASHNPAPYNGIKLWNPDGMAFDEAQQREVEEALDRSRFMAPTWDRIGAVFSRSDLVQQHIDTIIKDVGTAKARVVVDCGCGATSTITPFLLRQLGCDVLAINAQADGHFPGREPEPTEENLAALRATVPAVHADLGIAHDGDGDRMVAVDRTGTFVGGDLLLALFARKEVRSGLVVPVDASMVLEDLLPKARLLPLVELRRDEDLLHRHRTAEQRVLGAPHDPETAASDHGPKSIPVADELAGHLRERHRHRSYPIWRALDGCYRRRVP